MAVVDHVTNGEIQSNGKFERQANRFVTPFGDKEGELPVEKDRYRLLWAPVCPWANRSIIVRQLMGLEDVISVGTLDPIRPDVPWSDWAFTLDEGYKDPVLGIHLLSEAYKKADPDYQGRYTVPAIVDLKTGAVVNNDYFKLSLTIIYSTMSITAYIRRGLQRARKPILMLLNSSLMLLTSSRKDFQIRDFYSATILPNLISDSMLHSQDLTLPTTTVSESIKRCLRIIRISGDTRGICMLRVHLATIRILKRLRSIITYAA